MLNQLNLFYYFYETDIVKNVGTVGTNDNSSAAEEYQHIAEID
jgi:hypothetical protein